MGSRATDRDSRAAVAGARPWIWRLTGLRWDQHTISIVCSITRLVLRAVLKVHGTHFQAQGSSLVLVVTDK